MSTCRIYAHQLCCTLQGNRRVLLIFKLANMTVGPCGEVICEGPLPHCRALWDVIFSPQAFQWMSGALYKNSNFRHFEHLKLWLSNETRRTLAKQKKVFTVKGLRSGEVYGASFSRNSFMKKPFSTSVSCLNTALSEQTDDANHRHEDDFTHPHCVFLFVYCFVYCLKQQVFVFVLS